MTQNTHPDPDPYYRSAKTNLEGTSSPHLTTYPTPKLNHQPSSGAGGDRPAQPAPRPEDATLLKAVTQNPGSAFPKEPQYQSSSATDTRDSGYIVGRCAVWCRNWEVGGWRNSRDRPVKNNNLWGGTDVEY
ncbi:hypothetical protein GALMADRAFT_209350 [Galerina marginata CBS 339.88]|uniref:Uncharacterized protein n=1 Tax=Galerina marginata (strain CBS 339.88) TaxID=685588 RepID=A0A067T9K8_GALM3|nr:hypothetical protein GALMADRAFT_209350 [Galerina marginata CBS 339.88]